MFTVAIRYLNKERKITWDNGVLSGDHALVLILGMAAEALDGTPVGPGEGPVTMRDHLESPLSALMIINDEFGPIIGATGDVPKRIDVEEGIVP